MFAVDASLLDHARAVLGPHRRLRFVVGGAGTGKSTVCAEIATRRGVEVIDMDARLYGSWHGRFDPARHPANHAWSVAPDPLAWQLALDPDTFMDFHAASTAEALDLLADELAARDPVQPLLVDGGFGRLAPLAAAVPASWVACLALPARLRAEVWTASSERREMLRMVAGTGDPAEAVARFLALDERLSVQMVEDARLAGIPVHERDEGVGVGELADRVEAGLGIT